jgi:hypothetical protein
VRTARGEDVAWLEEIEQGLKEAQSRLESPHGSAR